MIDLYTVVGALVFLVMLGALSKIHQQVTELRTTLSKISSSMSAGITSLNKQLEKIEAELDLIFKQTKLPRPKAVEWIG